MNILAKVKESSKWVCENNNLVKINQGQIEEFAQKWANQKIKVPVWDSYHHFVKKDKETAQYLLILDALNFCFWAKKEKDKWQIKVGSKYIGGYFALALALKRAIQAYPLLDSYWLSRVTETELKEIFKGKNEIPLIKKRVESLRQVGQVLLKKYDGQAINLIEASQNEAAKLVQLLITDFSSFRDIAKFKEKKVYLLKRAQIFAGDVYSCFQGKAIGFFEDIDDLTAFADYKIPQILTDYDILKYNSSLLTQIKAKKELKSASSKEVIIRAATIEAVERIKKSLNQKGLNLNSCAIDWILWNESKSRKLKYPHHLTLGIYY